MPKSCFPVSKVQTLFSPISIPDKNTCELRNNVNPTSKKLKISRFLDVYVPTKKHEKSGRKTIHHEPVHLR